MSAATLLAWASALFAGVLALLIVFYERRSRAHWCFVLGMVVLAMESVFTGLTANGLLPTEVVGWQQWRLCAMSFLPGIWLLFSLSYARGRGWEYFARQWVTWAMVFAVPVGLAFLFREHLLAPVEEGGLWHQRQVPLAMPGIVLNLLFLVGAILILMNLERTYRAAVGTMRWRIKFMILGLGVLFVVRTYTCSQVLLFRAIDLPLQSVNCAALLVACLLILRSLVRAGHFEVNVYPSQAVLHNSLTVLLAGVYLVVVGAFARIVTVLGGDAAFQLKAFLVLVALVGLAVLLLSDRVRLRTQRFISQHFQRPQYDYRSVWRTFTEATARRVEAADLCGATVRMVSDLFQSLSVTIWLVDERKEKLTFAASTSLSEAKARQLEPDAATAAEAIAVLSARPRPVDLDSTPEVWASVLRRLHPDEFPEGGHRICVPMVTGGEILGLMILGDRVSGVPFSLQDLDLLTAVCDQAAASLLNIQLSHRLTQAKQLEAFQAMSAFFVHDLKNTASTLSLMLKNLPVHFHDPEFREDALRGIAKTVTHVNDLIGRLSLIRQGITLRLVEADFNEVVAEALRCLEATMDVELVKDFQPLPKTQFDPGQIQNVVTNLALNAKEATGPGGRITVQTTQQNGWIVLTVADNGCGITPEFIRDSLFRPFQSTKKKGVGIGMFQCKMIVESHQGKIEVESKPGQGTVFRVKLPRKTTAP